MPEPKTAERRRLRWCAWAAAIAVSGAPACGRTAKAIPDAKVEPESTDSSPQPGRDADTGMRPEAQHSPDSAESRESDAATAAVPCGALPRGLSSPRYVDLDGDKVADAIVPVGADTEYSDEVYLRRGSCWMRVARVRGTVERAPEVHNGLNDLMTRSACRVPRCNVTHTIYRFDGSTYAAARTWTEREGCLE